MAVIMNECVAFSNLDPSAAMHTSAQDADDNESAARPPVRRRA
jgi:hypothetical protein